ncbi:hypothetical protein NDU88_000346 [Pleurodeles waltl]|uniref:Uncharacterized protein n=1 Tax=Pleurodeles waltl TaxID=8319 RepID=A0AAV7TF73_PLEWA|nr:hypothetical protein NDU88_000346 [Pleurodeles waltl]
MEGDIDREGAGILAAAETWRCGAPAGAYNMAVSDTLLPPRDVTTLGRAREDAAGEPGAGTLISSPLPVPAVCLQTGKDIGGPGDDHHPGDAA